MSSRCCRASKVMDAFPSSCLFQHSTLQPFHGTSFQGSPAIPTSNCTRIASEGSPPSLDFQPRNVTGKVLLEVTLLGWCPHGSPKLPGDLWEMEKNFWKSTDRVQSSLPGQRSPMQGRSVPAFGPITLRAVAEVPQDGVGRSRKTLWGWCQWPPAELDTLGTLEMCPEALPAPGPCHCPFPWEALPTSSCFSFLLFMLIPKLSNWEECK